MDEAAIDSRDRATILMHYYRAMVGRADVWRMRLDATTNWAIGATAAVISFALGNAAAPHYVIHIAALLTFVFLLLEARRLTFYHLWQQRVLLLESGFIQPALNPAEGADVVADLAKALDPHLGRTVPGMRLSKAVARRLRRIYLYLFAVQLCAWVLKLSIHPTTTGRLDEIVERAHLGSIPGEASMGAVALGFVALLGFASVRGGVDRPGRGAPPAD